MKIKQLTKEQLIISIDRLTRFKEPEIKYTRVFKDVILNNLIEPKFKKTELDKMDYKELKHLAEEIINYSLPKNFDYSINEKIRNHENSIFNIDAKTNILLKNKINYEEILKYLPPNPPSNLEFLKALAGKPAKNSCFPVKKLILCEGITEEILLPKFAEICGFNFDQNGVYILSAGGKNQVVKYFYNYSDCLKIPIFVLLDNDAQKNLREIKPKLRKIDKIHLVKSGEFEDLLPNSLIIKTLKSATKNISIAPVENLENYISKVEFLEEFFRHRGLHEFKKAEFAQLVKENISTKADVSAEITEIINELSQMETTFSQKKTTR